MNVPCLSRRTPLRAMSLLLLAAVFAAVPDRSSAQEPTLEMVTSVEGITEYVMPHNGLRVLLFPDQSKPTATVNITYFVGSRHEAYGETGMAHLLEHLVFKGTPNHPDIPQELTEHGAAPNGTTWYDRTNYFETFPATEENLDWALDLEADRMVNSFISGEDLESEMTVVRNEMESGENNPVGMLVQRTMSTMYTWHNYGKSTIGARSDIENVPIERLQGFYRKYYQPDNALLVVAGKFDEEVAKRLVIEKFGPLERPDRTAEMKIWPTYTSDPTQDGERMVTLRRVGDVQGAVAAYHMPPGSHEDAAPVQVLSHAIGNSPSGRLYKALVEPGNAVAALSLAFQFREASPLLSGVIVSLDQDLMSARDLMLETLDDVVRSPVTGEEVDRAKAALLSGIENSFNEPESFATGLSEWAAMGDWRLFFLHRDRIEAVQAEDVQRVAAAYLKPSNRTVGVFVPEQESDRAEIPEVPDVEAMLAGYTGRAVVAQGEAFDPTPDNIDGRTITFTAPNGFEVAMLPKSTRGGAVNVSMRLHFGTEQTLMNKSTIGDIAGSMLMRGTTTRTREEVSDEFDRLQVQGGVTGSAMQANASMQTTRENLADALRLGADVLRNPAFDEAELELLKDQTIANIEQGMSDPQALAGEAFQRHMNPWPVGHPRYVPTMAEQVELTRAVTVDDVQAFHDEFYGSNRGFMSIVGDFDEAEVRALVDELFGDWTAVTASERIPDEFKVIDPGDIQIETPDKANALFIAAQRLEIGEDHPDYPAMMMANYMLGGGFLNSRLATKIRQEEGISYGVGSQFSAHPVDGTGMFITFAIYAPENSERLIAAFREVIETALADGFAADEFEQARSGYLDSRYRQRAQDDVLTGQMAANLYWDRTMQWDAEYEAAVAGLTADDIVAAMRRHIDLDRMTLVQAGDFAGAQKRIIP